MHGLPAGRRRVRVPVLQPDPVADGAGERGVGARAHGPGRAGPGRGIALRDKLGVKAGDELRIAVDTGGAAPVVLTERLAGFVDEPIGTFAYMALDRLAAQPGLVEPAGSALLTYAAGVDADAMRQRLMALDEVAAVEANENFLQTFESYMAFFYVMIGFMIVFGGAMALALIYASISVNIAERSVELATLRAEGVRQSVLSRLITAENLIVTLFGVPPGIGLGYLLAKPLVATYTNDLWRFNIAVEPLTPLLAGIAIILAALISQWPGLRALNRLDIATVVRLRST